jgi:hypothetical protein
MSFFSEIYTPSQNLYLTGFFYNYLYVKFKIETMYIYTLFYKVLISYISSYI